MKLTFLEALVPLTKIYKKVQGELVKEPYPLVTDVTSHEVDVPDLKAFERALVQHASMGHCLLKGNVSRALTRESRAGTTTTDASTAWVCLDIDGLPDTYKGAQVTIDSLLHDLGYGDVSYLAQWSASYGIENNNLRAHVYMLVDKDTAAPLLKQWLIQLNLDTAVLYDSLRLTKTGNAISWPLDITTCQNDKLIYITPPVLKGLKDPMAGKQRVQYVKKPKAKLSIDISKISLARNAERVRNVLDSLRQTAGLPKKKVTYRTVGATEIMSKPDACVITGKKEERGFVYFNLNGGDSWGYFHPETNPDFIYNFKGEPTYLTKELLPDYWADLHSRGAGGRKPNANLPNSQGEICMAFLDPESDKYWRGTYDTNADHLQLTPTNSLTTLRMYAKANGIVFPDDVVPEWSLVFDPHDNVRVDVKNQVVNLYQPTKYMRAQAREVKQCPKTIKKVIHHVVGSNDEAFDRFINWLAYVLQERDVAITAWVMHGVSGTGKGTLLSRILRPLFGEEHVAIPRMSELDKEFNSFINRSLLVVVDEFEAAALQSEKGVMADLKRYITEKLVQLRVMRQDARKVRNYSAWIFFSNAQAPVNIPRHDRRFNVGHYQTQKLAITDAELARIDKELQDFHDFLLYYKVDKNLVFEPLQNKDRDDLIDLTESTLDTVTNAFMNGTMAHFVDALPTDNRYLGNAMDNAKVADYKSVITEILDRTDRNTGVCNMARDEFKVVYTYLVGKTIPDSPNKFTSLLKHHRLLMNKVRVNGKPVVGAQVIWKDISEWDTYQAVVAPPKVVPAKQPKLARVK